MLTASPEPSARDIVLRTLRNLRKIGSPTQQREAEQLEVQLLGGGMPRAANFARRGKKAAPANPEAKP